MIGEVAAGSMMDEERRAGAGDVSLPVSGLPLNQPPRACKESRLRASTTNKITHTTAVLAH